jgi:hypothetical protein
MGITAKQHKTTGSKTGLTCMGIFLKIKLCIGVGCLTCKATVCLYQYNKNITNVMRCTSLSWNDTQQLSAAKIWHNIKSGEGTKSFSMNISFKNRTRISSETKQDFVNFRPNASKMTTVYSCGTSYSLLVQQIHQIPTILTEI